MEKWDKKRYNLIEMVFKQPKTASSYLFSMRRSSRTRLCFGRKILILIIYKGWDKLLQIFEFLTNTYELKKVPDKTCRNMSGNFSRPKLHEDFENRIGFFISSAVLSVLINFRDTVISLKKQRFEIIQLDFQNFDTCNCKFLGQNIVKKVLP